MRILRKTKLVFTKTFAPIVALTVLTRVIDKRNRFIEK